MIWFFFKMFYNFLHSMKKKSFFLGIIIASVATISCSVVALYSMNRQSLSISNAASKTYTLTCSNFSTFVSNKYLTSPNGNRINFTVSNCSGNTIKPNGYFRNSTKFARINMVRITYSSTSLSDAICRYTNNLDDFVSGHAPNYVLQSGSNSPDLGVAYIQISNPADFNNNDTLTVSSFVISYTC